MNNYSWLVTPFGNLAAGRFLGGMEDLDNSWVAWCRRTRRDRSLGPSSLSVDRRSHVGWIGIRCALNTG